LCWTKYIINSYTIKSVRSLLKRLITNLWLYIVLPQGSLMMNISSLKGLLFFIISSLNIHF
jgi:hypothetical protein